MASELALIRVHSRLNEPVEDTVVSALQSVQPVELGLQLFQKLLDVSVIEIKNISLDK